MRKLARFSILTVCLFTLLASTMPAAAFELDPFSVKRDVSTSPEKKLIVLNTVENPCRFDEINGVVDLLEAVERALCNNPQTRQAWANVKIQAAQVGVAEAAYLPTLDGSAGLSKGPNSYQVTGIPELSYDARTTNRSGSLNASWTLFDFGLRRANLENARQLLVAANATQDGTLQTVFAATTQAYYDFLSAQGALDAFRESEEFSRESFMVADAKYRAGAGTLADKLQAQTTLSQAVLDRVKAVGDVKNKQGALAVTMGLDANTPFTVEISSETLPDATFVKSVDQMISEAKRTHPSLLAAQAQLQAAQANVAAAKAEGMPSISLTGNFNSNNQSGVPPSDTNTRSSSIGLQLKIPLFEGISRGYRVQSAKAQVELRAADLRDTEQKISLDVWKNYQSLITETEDLKATEELLQSANQSFDVAQGRYKSGVGTIIELLNAQVALAKAKQQRVQALSNWRSARLQLAGSLGRLGFWAIQ